MQTNVRIAAGFSIALLVISVFALGATVVHAQSDEGFLGDYGSFSDEGSWGDYGTYVDEGSFGDYGTYADEGSYGDYGTYADEGYLGDYGSYSDEGYLGDYGTYADEGYLGDYGTYADEGYLGDYGSYAEEDSLGDYGSYNEGFGGDSFGGGYTDSNGVRYSSSGGQSMPRYSMPSTPMRVSAPPSYSAPRPVPTPSYPPVVPIPAPRPQPPVFIPPAPVSSVSTVTTNNTCVNYSCNTTITDNSINGSFNDNSVNGSFNTVTLKPAVPQRPIQYVFPQAPVPQSPYVSLSQIPYTGFDGGPLSTALYFGGLLAFAGSVAYLVLYYKGGFSGALAAFAPAKAAVAASTLAAPSMFGTLSPIQMSATRTPVQTREAKEVSYSVGAPKDSMQIVTSQDGGAPRIVITRA